MRREVLQDVRRLQQLLEHHAKEGLPAQVIPRAKALEYLPRHYGQVYVNEERPSTVAEALVGINQLIGAVQHRRATRVHCRRDFTGRALLWFRGRLRRGRNMPYDTGAARRDTAGPAKITDHPACALQPTRREPVGNGPSDRRCSPPVSWLRPRAVQWRPATQRKPPRDRAAP